MLPPLTIQVPSGTNAIYLTALSLFNKTSSVSISWTDGSATFGADFVGPSPTYVLGDKVFDLPIVVVDPIPTEISVSFDFNDDMTHQHSVSGPVTKKVGPEGIEEGALGNHATMYFFSLDTPHNSSTFHHPTFLVPKPRRVSRHP